jgi:predicted neuraminidase
MHKRYSQFDGFVELKAPRKIYLQDTAGNKWSVKDTWIVTSKDRVVYSNFSGSGILYTDLMIRSQWLLSTSDDGARICDIFTTEEAAWDMRHQFYEKHGQAVNDVLYWNMLAKKYPLGDAKNPIQTLVKSEPLFED